MQGVLVDTSIWIDHLVRRDAQVAQLLQSGVVLMHPFVIGEIACGNLKNREPVLKLLGDLPSAVIAQHDEVLELVKRHALHGEGIGWIDAQLLASVVLTPEAGLWTRDKRLRDAAESLGCAFSGSAGYLH